jgi:hypothetical protein
VIKGWKGKKGAKSPNTFPTRISQEKFFQINQLKFSHFFLDTHNILWFNFLWIQFIDNASSRKEKDLWSLAGDLRTGLNVSIVLNYVQIPAPSKAKMYSKK